MRLEKRALSIIIPGEDDQTAIKKLGIKPLQIHHEHLCQKLFQAANYELRKNRTFEVPRTRTNRLKNTFIFSRCNSLHSDNFNTSSSM